MANFVSPRPRQAMPGTGSSDNRLLRSVNRLRRQTPPD
jgi:hypothetical protein